MNQEELEGIARRAIDARRSGLWKPKVLRPWGRHTAFFDPSNPILQEAGLQRQEDLDDFLEWEKEEE